MGGAKLSQIQNEKVAIAFDVFFFPPLSPYLFHEALFFFFCFSPPSTCKKRKQTFAKKNKRRSSPFFPKINKAREKLSISFF